MTRSYSLQWYAFKVPLTPVLLPTATAAANNAGGIGFAAGDDLYTANSLTRMPTSGPASYALSGMPWFPNLNNGKAPALRQAAEAPCTDAHPRRRPALQLAA